MDIDNFTEMKLVKIKFCCLWLVSPIASWNGNMDRGLVLFGKKTLFSFKNGFWQVNGVFVRLIKHFLETFSLRKILLIFLLLIYLQTRRTVNIKSHV